MRIVRLISIVTLFVIGSCQKANLFLPFHTRILGHGGMGISSQYPINSLESILNALNICAHGIEVDVQLSKDGQLVAFHDELMYNSTNLDEMINSKTWEEIESGYYTSFPHANYNIVRLDDIFAAIEHKERYTFTLDCKLYHDGTNDNFEQDYTEAILALLEKHSILNYTTIESVDTNFLLLLKGKSEPVRAYYYTNDFEPGLAFIQNNGLEGLTMHRELVSAEDIAEAHQADKKIALFGISQSRELEDAFKKAADFVQVDNLRSILNAVD